MLSFMRMPQRGPSRPGQDGLRARPSYGDPTYSGFIPLNAGTSRGSPPGLPRVRARYPRTSYCVALHSVLPSLASQSTFAPGFQPSPLTLYSLPSSVITVAMP